MFLFDLGKIQVTLPLQHCLHKQNPVGYLPNLTKIFLSEKLTGIGWLLWIGVAIGIAAAIANVYKAYSKQYKEFEKLAKDPRYNMGQTIGKDDDDED